MALRRGFKETIRARVKRDPGFRKALLHEGIEHFLSDDMETGRIILRDFISTPPQVIVAASGGQNPFALKIAADTYTANLFLSARYTIRAQAFCRPGAKDAVDSSLTTVDGADTSVSTVDLTLGKGECGPKRHPR